MIMITGHRPNKLGGYKWNPTQQWVQQELNRAVKFFYRAGERDFMSGMALGVDQWFAATVLEMQANLYCVIPFEGQESIWPSQSQQEYRSLLNRAQHVTTLNGKGYAPWKMQARNEYMVNNSDHIIAVWDGTSGGTANCVRYAETRDKPIYRIDPLTKEITWNLIPE